MLLALPLLLASCGGAAGGKGPAAPACVPAEGMQPLTAETFHARFEEEQAAYYVEEGGTLLLLVRAKEGADEAEVVGRLLVLLAAAYDFGCDPREMVLLVCYKGVIAEKRNVGILVKTADLALLQSGKMDIDGLTERALYRTGISLKSVEHLVGK